MKTRYFFSLVAAALTVTTSAGAWNLAPCSGTDVAKRVRYASSVRHALPGDLNYVPKPFPASDAQVTEDFVHQFRVLRSHQTPEQMAPHEKQLLALLDANQLLTTVTPIENWSGRRCLGPRDGDRMFLLRFFDTRTRAEVARATLQDSGLLDVTTYREPGVAAAWWATPIEAPSDVAKRIAATTGQQLVDAQYVTTYGTFECDALLPCVAMRSPVTNTTYVADALGHIVELPANAKRFSRVHDLPRLEDIDRVKKTLTARQKLMSLGGDGYAVVETLK